MKQLLKDLASVSKALKQLAAKTDLIMEKLENMDVSKTGRSSGSQLGGVQKKGPGKAVGKKKEAKEISATQNILGIISRSKEGIGTALVMKKTGLKDNNIRAVLSRLRKQGKIKRVGRGLYVKA